MAFRCRIVLRSYFRGGGKGGLWEIGLGAPGLHFRLALPPWTTTAFSIGSPSRVTNIATWLKLPLQGASTSVWTQSWRLVLLVHPEEANIRISKKESNGVCCAICMRFHGAVCGCVYFMLELSSKGQNRVILWVKLAAWGSFVGGIHEFDGRK